MPGPLSSALIPTMIRTRQPGLWINPDLGTPASERVDLVRQVDGAIDRLARADGLLRSLFKIPENDGSVLSSDLIDASDYATSVGEIGAWYVKADHALPVAGSVKARGGFHEVIAFAERLAVDAGLVGKGADLIALNSPVVRSLFSSYTVAVGSTGNLGLAIGMMASALGFRAVVHMSSDAKEWKKARLRERGVEVVEHPGDYAQAVALGRELASRSPSTHFVDDERSVDLFVGYAAAAKELQRDLYSAGIVVDASSPLFVYLPCGVGGAPGGITFGLKLVFGESVHCFFVEPVASPCMLVQLSSNSDEPTSVYDLGLDNRTELDGLAVGQASMLVAPLMKSRLSGIYTVADDEAFRLLGIAHDVMHLGLEPSAAAALAGPTRLLRSEAGQNYLSVRALGDKLSSSTHVMWTTGGAIVPEEERKRFLERARAGR
ncbi:D-serine ammonia-lyase [Mesorhizobium sp.]|uniref:D-serine ammonia-lyase n=1 Tax=Mesorhizobium sp. TaxID=1871066 RepID=UPI000FE9E2FB|nr:D-serine ammonia-lyase [Mesorhizobium sp.]RWJ05701.1 MAG: D-serine ammonia-lyase [Mesorhizobium sp.]